MNLIDQHKALIITFLISGIVVFGLFSIQLKLKGNLLTESYYLLEPEPEITKEELQKFEDLTGPSTNKAFNEDQEYKDMMRNFKTVSANDFERTTKALEEAKAAGITDEAALRLVEADAYPHFLHVMAMLFVANCVIMLVIGMIKPRKEAFELEYTEQVSIEPYKYVKQVGIAICVIVISIYIYFAK